MRAIAATLTFVLLTITAFAQRDAGTISGIVKDPDGATVRGAQISLIHSHGVVVHTTVSDASGRFFLENVIRGRYELSTTRLGFDRHRAAIYVANGANREVNFALQVDPVSVDVTITAEAGLVADARSVDQQVNVINEKEILERAPEVVAQVVDEEAG